MSYTDLEHIPARIMEASSRYVHGRDETIRLLTVALSSGGHILVEGHPGTGKTLLARCFAQAIGGVFKRIQLVADMLPGDITGFMLYRADGTSQFMPGPIFANVVLADELNRTTPRTQAAFLEAMQEGRVTVEGSTYPLPQPFLAIATQMPSGAEGTYALPEGEMDRFMLRLWSGYPDRQAEAEILSQADALERPSVDAVTTPEAVLALREAVRQVEVAAPVMGYVLDIIERLRRHGDVASGPSPRGALALYRASRALAYLDGRSFTVPDDVRQLALPVLAHRLRLTPEAEIEGISAGHVLQEVLEGVPVPKGVA